MKKEVNDLIKQAGSITALLAAAILSYGSTYPLVANVIGGILTNILANKIEKSKLLKLQEILAQQNPSNLNHNIEKLTQEAIVWAIKNICYKYKAYCVTESQGEQLKNFEKTLIKKIETIDKASWVASDALLQQIDQLTDQTNLIQQIISVDSSWPIINEAFPFPTFFKDEFVSNFQLCFGELLKDKGHHAALIAYNRNVSIHLQKSLIDQKDKIDQLLLGNQDLMDKISSLSKSPQKRFEKKVVLPQIKISLDEYLKPLHNNVQLLVDQNGTILVGIEDIKKESKHHTQQLKNFGDKLDRNNKKKSLIIMLPIVALILSYFGFKYWQSTQPFIFTVAIDYKSINQELPIKDATVSLLYHDKTENLVTNNNEAIFKGLPSIVRGNSVQIKVHSEGFKVIDTLVIAKNILNLVLHRDDTYATMKGRVKNAQTGQAITEAIVRVQDVATQTDSEGNFHLSIPESQQKTLQRLIIIKEGYKSWERIEPVIKNTESIIQLEKL